MNTFPEKVTSRLYRMVSGVSANDMRFHYQDLSGAIAALDAHTQVDLKDWREVFKETNDSRDLADLFNKYGSDKAGKHNYHVAYASLLRRHAPLSILEIGLGTNNPRMPSGMGVNGKPGAAERAFRDWAPNSKVYGADVDERVLFAEERIKTFFVDQTKPNTLKELAAKLPPLDLVIDDGLHFPHANLNTINFALPLLKENGLVVVEDIVKEFIPFWHVAIAVLSARYECQFVQMKSEAILIIKARR
jgi:SAM-dependent methyltransferase